MSTISQLRIDTSVVRIPGPVSSKSFRGEGLAPNSATASINKGLRSVSPASTSSTLSLASPAASSANGSTSSLLLPNASASTSYSATSVSTASSSKLSPPPIEKNQSDYVLAMHDFVAEQKNATCLTFRAGQVIHVLNRDSSGWWDGELDGQRGWFPSNYVNGDLGLLADDDLPPSMSKRRAGHAHTHSTVSTNSFASSTSSRQGPFSRDEYCPPLMVPLLHALSLLQNAVRSNRIAHFQPSVACLISCVRSILAAAECLSRDAPSLRRYPSLAQERKRVLSDLASIVTQAKKASLEDEMDEEERDMEVEKMVRLGGQVFSRVRRFLAVAVQCGLPFPDKRLSAEYPPMLSESLSSLSSQSSDSPSSSKPAVTAPTSGGDEDDTLRLTPWKTTNAVSQRPRMRARDRPGTPGTAMKARSMGDLRSPRRAPTTENEVQPVPALTPSKLQKIRAFGPANGRLNSHKHELSVSSISSMSSFSSADSSSTPNTPPFPSGPSTYDQLMDALRHTHDQYLSTIAAFIGHAHSHSRSSHASSTGHMYELVREIVEIVCKLLVVVEAVLHHPTVPVHKVANLRGAKEGLYNVTSSLAESVRALTGPLPSTMTEEQEKAALIRSATDALKAGADCVAAVKMCLSRSSGGAEFIIEIPGVSEECPSPMSPHTLLQGIQPRLMKSVSLDALHPSAAKAGADDEDRTIQFHGTSPSAMFRQTEQPIIEVSEEREAASPEPADPLESTAPIMRLAERPKLTALQISKAEVPADLQSPTSIVRTDDGTTWEGSHRQHEQGKNLDEKILNGDLPSVPSTPLPVFMQPVDSESWTQSHDYSLEDVAYNTESVLVGASMQALVEKMTPHASIVDPAFSAVFFMTFRLFSSPAELVQVVIDRYNILPPPDLDAGRLYIWQQRKGIPVRLRVSNFIKLWLETHWRPASDNGVLPLLLDFNRDALSGMFAGPAQRIHDMIMMRMHQTEDILMTPRLDRVRDAGMPINPPMINSPSEIPRPVMTKTLFSHLRSRTFGLIAITDFDCLELARQLTIMECNLFCVIQPDEVLESGLEGAKFPVNVRAVSTLSTVITGWVAESILNEIDIKKRTALVKFFVKLADRCTTLHNFSTSRSILAALDSSTISRLHQTWMTVPQKQKLQLDAIRKLADHARNYHEYRSRLRNTAPPAVPFLGLYLTDITFCREGNPSHRTSPLAADKKLINFNKYHKMARIVQDLQRFQVPYTLKEIPEVQAYLNDAFERSKHHGDLQDLYRRSLLVEPKQPADTPPAGDVRQLFPWASRSSSQQPTPI